MKHLTRFRWLSRLVSRPALALGFLVGFLQVAVLWSNNVEKQAINSRSLLQIDTNVLPQETPAEKEVAESQRSFSLLLLVLLEMAAFTAAYFLKKSHFKYLQEAGATLLFGTFIGIITYLVKTSTSGLLQAALTFDSTIFFLFLLPPIIFESGYNMNRKNFFQNLGSVIGYAFGGTTIATFVTGILLYVVVQMGVMTNLTFLECLLWGSLISATDPVTVLAIFKELKVDFDLYSNVFGESVLNDAVAIVLYRTLLGFLDHEFTAAYFFLAIGQFLLIFIGSMCFGIIVALISSLFFKYTHIDRYPYLETAVVALFGYSSYLLAEGSGLSGIVSILFCGIVMAQYTYENLSKESKELSLNFFSILALLTETLVFGYLGLSLFIFEQVFDVVFIFAGIAVILLARAANVYPLTAIVNVARSRSGGTIITQKYQFFMWFAGLRGAIAFILSIDVPTAGGPVMRSTTIVIVYFTIFVMGGMTVPLLNLLKIPKGVEATSSGLEEDAYGEFTVKMQHGFNSFDTKILKPFFIKNFNPTYNSVVMDNRTTVKDVEEEEEEENVQERTPDGTIRIQFSHPESNTELEVVEEDTK